MALNYTKTPIQLAAVLKVSQALKAVHDYAVLASDASHFARLLSANNGFGQSDTEEKNAYSSLADYYKSTLGAAISAEFVNHREAIESSDGFFGLLEADLSASDEKDAGGAIDYKYEDLDGAITIIARNGIWGALRREMLADGYYVTANTITVGSLTAKGGNRGLLTKTSMTAESHCLTGTLVITVEDENVTSPKLKLVNVLPLPLASGETEIEADNQLTPEKSLEDGPTGITCVLTRTGLSTPTESGDAGNIFSGTTIATPAEGDMNGGVLQVRVLRQAGSNPWLVEFYSTSSRDKRVGSTAFAGTTGTVALDVTLKNGTRFQTTFHKANANTLLPNTNDEDDDITFDIETPRKGDRWTIALSSNDAGNYSTKLAQVRRVSLPVSGSSLFTDSNAASISITG